MSHYVGFVVREYNEHVSSNPQGVSALFDTREDMTIETVVSMWCSKNVYEIIDGVFGFRKQSFCMARTRDITSQDLAILYERSLYENDFAREVIRLHDIVEYIEFDHFDSGSDGSEVANMVSFHFEGNSS